MTQLSTSPTSGPSFVAPPLPAHLRTVWGGSELTRNTARPALPAWVIGEDLIEPCLHSKARLIQASCCHRIRAGRSHAWHKPMLAHSALASHTHTLAHTRPVPAPPNSNSRVVHPPPPPATRARPGTDQDPSHLAVDSSGRVRRAGREGAHNCSCPLRCAALRRRHPCVQPRACLRLLVSMSRSAVIARPRPAALG